MRQCIVVLFTSLLCLLTPLLSYDHNKSFTTQHSNDEDETYEVPCTVAYHWPDQICSSNGDECKSLDERSYSLCEQVFHAIGKAYENETDVRILQPSTSIFHSAVSKWPKILDDISVDSSCSLIVYPKPTLDRECLLSHTKLQYEEPSIFSVTDDIKEIVERINQICGTYRTINGTKTMAGLHRQYILDNLYSLKRHPKSRMAAEVFSATMRQHAMPECERIDAPTNWHQFFNDYLKISRPVIIQSAMKDWPAMRKWSSEFLVNKYGNNTVHIKMSPNTDYEGIESVELWDHHESFNMPEKVRKQLLYPDLVVPRPAPAKMKFSDFIEITQMIGNGTLSNVSAYLEYSSIKQHFQELELDVNEMPFVKDIAKLSHLNIWLSDGNTLGKLHFDPFDNFLCQISGKKEVILFEPYENENMYEAHIPEAQFSVNQRTWKFSRSELMESTSMVMSPVDIKKIDSQRFPKFLETRPLNCTISEGEVLFMPSFWWHEVQSYPSTAEHRNLAVNFWYEPFLTKEFPCPKCKLDVNQFYRNLL